MSRRVVVAAIAASVVISTTGMLMASPPSAFADTHAQSHATGGPAVVTLGDSYISGEGGRWRGNGNTVTPGSRYGTDLAAYNCKANETWCRHDPKRVYGDSYSNGCNRASDSEMRYVTKVRVQGASYDINGGGRFNIACSGATSQAIHEKSFKGERRQIDQLAGIAAQKDVKLIVLSIGGNDIGFSDIIGACVRAFTTGNRPCKDSLGGRIPGLINQLKAGVVRSIDAIRTTMSAAGYGDFDYRFILQAYPSPIPKAVNNRYPETGWSRWTSGGCPFYNVDSDWAYDTLVPAIDDALNSVSKSRHVEFLDLRNTLSGHEVCAKDAKQATSSNSLRYPLPKGESEWVRWIGIPRVGQGQTQEFLHPNYYGQQAIGACLNAIATSSAGTLVCSAPAL